MAKPINLVLFGDQTVEKLSSIQSLVRHSKTSPAAKRFLREATDLLQLNFDRLAKEDRAWNHEIHTLLGLAEENLAEDKPNGVLATVLMCIGRLGELIVHAEEDPSILGSESNPVHALAFCTGLLPASALVAARDTSELFRIASEIISITFRMAHEIIRRMKLIEDTNRSWAITMVGKSPKVVQPILDEFHKVQGIPYPKQIAIGVVSNGWLTLMGAPSTLARFMNFSEEMELAPKVATDTNGAVHTPYMPAFDVEAVLGDSPILDTPVTSKARIISPATCKPYSHTTLKPLLAEIMVDIAHNILRINDTIEEFIPGLEGQGLVSMVVAGPTGHLPAIERVLQNKGIDYRQREHDKKPRDGTTASRGGSDLVAIVGMSGRFPGSETIEDFFEDLLEGKGQIKRIPKSRFDLDVYFDPTGTKRNTTTAQHGAFLDNPGHFDNRLFNVSPREALQMDPLQRLLFTTSWEALESAGYSKDGTLATESNRIATYYGQASEDWRDILNNEDIDIYYVPSLSRPFGPSRLSYHHKWGGGTYALDAACATSTTAVHLACQALNARECDTAVAGGGSILISPHTFAGLSKSGMISNNGGCRTYHDDADGYVRGEGVGVVILKRLEDAYADNDNILGVIKGSARSYTSTSTSITHPSAESQARIYEEVLRQTSTVPNEIAYVEMHGTGTQAGDFEEMSSVIKVMGKERSKGNNLTVGAVKANVGHGEGAAGVTSLIKVLMMLRDRKIPPQPGIPFKLNHNFPQLDKVHVRIAGLSGKDMTLKPSPAALDGKIKCLVNSFDASGGNTSLVVEEPPERPSKVENPLPCHVVTLSARTKTSLQENRRRLLDYLTRNPATKLADLAYTTTARRMHEVLRVAYTAKSTREIINALRDGVSKESDDPKTKSPSMNLIFAFTGQGSQYAGMGKQLYQQSAAMRNLLETYHQMAQHQGFPAFLHLVSDEQSDISTVSTVSVQLAVVALEIATAHLLKTWGIKPDVIIGHSLGEYSALCVTGVLSVSDTLFLVGSRAQLMESRLSPDEYSMLAIGSDSESTRKLLEASGSSAETDIACLNAPQMTVVSGPMKDVQALKSKIEEGGSSRATMLRVPYGFHSQHVEPVLEDFKAMASGVEFKAPTVPLASTLLGEIVEVGNANVFSPLYLVRQARERVNFVGALESMKTAGLIKPQTHIIEVGPEPVCIGLARRTLDLPPTRLLSSMKSSENNWATISTSLAALYKAGANISWPQYYKEFKDSLNLLDLPFYAFDNKDFWTPFVERTSTNAIPSAPLALAPGQEKKITPTIPSFSTTTLQRIEHEAFEKKTATVTFASHTSEPSLFKAISGHVLNGITICSLSVFCDMAKSATQYAYEKLKPGQKVPIMSVLNVDMTHALVVAESDPSQIIKTTVLFSTATNKADITFHSIKQGAITEHGGCQVIIEDSREWFSQMSETQFLINARMQSLKDMSSTGKAHRLLKPVVYKLFDNLLSYGKDYQGMEEVWIDGDCHDAFGTIKMPDTNGSGHFLYNPFWTDCAIHLAGFLVNGSLKYPENIACLSTGFDSWRLIEELKADDVYTCYVSMRELETTGLLSGTAYVYNGENKLVQVTTGIRFQKIKKVVLNAVLNPRGGATTATAPSTKVKQVAMKSPDSLVVPITPKPSVTGSTTPNTFDGTSSDRGEDDSGIATPASSVDENEGSNLLDKFLSIVASESGYDAKDMDSGTAFADMGLDSLMAITIIATVQRDTGVELPATFLLDHLTVGDAKIYFVGEEDDSGPEQQPEISKPAAVSKGPKASKAPAVPDVAQPHVVDKVEKKPAPKVEAAQPSAESVKEPTSTSPPAAATSGRKSKAQLLHGSPSSTGPKLFLFPDGSGSPGRYIQFPALGADVNVYGLESAFLKAPTEYTCNLEAICDLFIYAIKVEQSTGPYILGGFSLGAIYAYEAARKLLLNNEQVDGLLLLDMAAPKAIKIAAAPTHDELKDSGFLPPTGRQTNAQKDHLASTVRAMANHSLGPCPSNRQPKKTILVSSKDGVAAGKTSYLSQWARGSASPSQGWEDLAGSVENREIDASHFDLLKPPAVGTLKDICTDALTVLR